MEVAGLARLLGIGGIGRIGWIVGIGGISRIGRLAGMIWIGGIGRASTWKRRSGADMVIHRLLEAICFPRVPLNRRKLAQRLAGKSVLITGASSGIGEQLSYLLAEYRVHLILAARRGDKLQAMKQEIESRGVARVSVYALDLRDHERTKEMLDDLLAVHDGVDIFVNNAGHSIRRSIYDSLDRYHDVTRTMAINYLAPVQIMLSLIPALRRRSGHVINISTVNALLLPVAGWAAYQASKTAFDTWFRSVQPELNKHGVRTTSIYLPLVRTPMILPTAAYDQMPAMSSSHAAEVIARMIYGRRRVWRPWWLIFGQLASLIFR